MTDPIKELHMRDSRFRYNMDRFYPNWDIAIFFHRIDIYYFTHTLQNGIYIVPRNNPSMYFVKRNFDRATYESPIEQIYQIKHVADIKNHLKGEYNHIYINKNNTPVSVLENFIKYFPCENVYNLNHAYSYTRSIKSDYEIELQKKSGDILMNTLEHFAPQIIEEGISEYHLGIKLFNYMVDKGHELISRMNNFNAELFLGTISFSENACYYSTHDGPVGLIGLSRSSPFIGSKERKLKKGDIIVLDLVCNYQGYHTDKTIVYSFCKADQTLKQHHNKCLDIEKAVAEKLIPGNKPSEIYIEIMSNLDNEFLDNFMGYKSNQVKFLGHGIGLTVDEYPVIAKGFDVPLEANMTIAIEPKKCIGNNCMVGSENTYLINNTGATSITGARKELIEL